MEGFLPESVDSQAASAFDTYPASAPREQMQDTKCATGFFFFFWRRPPPLRRTPGFFTAVPGVDDRWWTLLPGALSWFPFRVTLRFLVLWKGSNEVSSQNPIARHQYEAFGLIYQVSSPLKMLMFGLLSYLGSFLLLVKMTLYVSKKYIFWKATYCVSECCQLGRSKITKEASLQAHLWGIILIRLTAKRRSTLRVGGTIP